MVRSVLHIAMQWLTSMRCRLILRWSMLRSRNIVLVSVDVIGTPQHYDWRTRFFNVLLDFFRIRLSSNDLQSSKMLVNLFRECRTIKGGDLLLQILQTLPMVDHFGDVDHNDLELHDVIHLDPLRG